MGILGSNAIRAILIIIIGMVATDIGTWGSGAAIDWKPVVAKYAVALLAAVLRLLSVPVATVKVAAPI